MIKKNGLRFQKLFENIHQLRHWWEWQQKITHFPIRSWQSLKELEFSCQFLQFTEIREFIQNRKFLIRKDSRKKLPKPDIQWIGWLLVTDHAIALVWEPELNWLCIDSCKMVLIIDHCFRCSFRNSSIQGRTNKNTSTLQSRRLRQNGNTIHHQSSKRILVAYEWHSS